jgi:hypothetical protein
LALDSSFRTTLGSDKDCLCSDPMAPGLGTFRQCHLMKGVCLDVTMMDFGQKELVMMDNDCCQVDVDHSHRLDKTLRWEFFYRLVLVAHLVHCCMAVDFGYCLVHFDHLSHWVRQHIFQLMDNDLLLYTLSMDPWMNTVLLQMLVWAEFDQCQVMWKDVHEMMDMMNGDLL